jgi:hypothetical protein
MRHSSRPRATADLSKSLHQGGPPMPTVMQFIPNPRSPVCSICNNPVDLTIDLTDQDGKAVHEECYVRKVRQEDLGKPPKNS